MFRKLLQTFFFTLQISRRFTASKNIDDMCILHRKAKFDFDMNIHRHTIAPISTITPLTLKVSQNGRLKIRIFFKTGGFFMLNKGQKNNWNV